MVDDGYDSRSLPFLLSIGVASMQEASLREEDTGSYLPMRRDDQYCFGVCFEERREVLEPASEALVRGMVQQRQRPTPMSHKHRWLLGCLCSAHLRSMQSQSTLRLDTPLRERLQMGRRKRVQLLPRLAEALLTLTRPSSFFAVCWTSRHLACKHRTYQQIHLVTHYSRHL